MLFPYFNATKFHRHNCQTIITVTRQLCDVFKRNQWITHLNQSYRTRPYVSIIRLSANTAALYISMKHWSETASRSYFTDDTKVHYELTD